MFLLSVSSKAIAAFALPLPLSLFTSHKASAGRKRVDEQGEEEGEDENEAEELEMGEEEVGWHNVASSIVAELERLVEMAVRVMGFLVGTGAGEVELDKVVMEL
ncbi:hypothetical protein BGX20_003473, partial [Mortierella sp. AD010]